MKSKVLYGFKLCLRHRPGGRQANFDLRLVNITQTGLLSAGINTPLNIDPDERILFAGDVSKSILFHRTNSLDPTIMMPPLQKELLIRRCSAVARMDKSIEPVVEQLLMILTM